MNVVKDEKSDLDTDFHCILSKWRNHLCQLLRGLMMLDRLKYRQESHMYPNEPNAFEVKMATEKLKRRKSPLIDEILTELNKAGGRTFRTQIHNLINSIWNKEEFA